jgi:lipopolysaccharide export system permease protein
MNILDRYIGRAVTLGIIAALSVVLTLDFLISFTGEMSEIGKAQYGFWQAIVFILLGTPQKIYEIFPMIAVLGTMLGLGMLAGNHELTAMRAAGVSLLRLIGAVLKTAAIITFVAIFIGEVVAPPAVQYAKLNRVRAMEHKISLNTDYGLWARDGDTYIHIRRVEHDGKLIGINLYVFDEFHSMRETYQARSAEYKGDTWLLQNVEHKKLTAEGISKTTVESMSWQTLLKPDIVSVVSVSPEDLSLWRLYGYIDYLHENHLDASHYELSFWTKLFSPLTITAMIFLAIPFIFGTLRGVGVGQRVFVGFLIGLTFFIVSRLIGQAGLVYTSYPLLPASLPPLIVLGLGVFLMRRVR